MFFQRLRHRHHLRFGCGFAAFLLCWGASNLLAQSEIVDVTVHSPGLEHNLLGDPADQPVSIYLPEAYRKNPQQRFPVLYFLHGYSDTRSRHEEAELFRKPMDALIARGLAKPFIIVLPNGINKYLGSFYANSSTIGNWDDFITKDVVQFVDEHYRTETVPARRIIAGHSMGGYGALTLAFRHPEVFGAVYAMSPCCTDLVGDSGPGNPAWAAVGKLTSPERVPEALHGGQFFAAAFAAMIAALAPDRAAAIFGDAPFSVQDGQPKTNPEAYSEIAMKMPANMVAPLLPKIAQLKGIFIEYGAQDPFTHITIGAQETSQRLSQAGIPNTLEVFQGDHVNRVPERIAEHLVPWVEQQIAH